MSILTIHPNPGIAAFAKAEAIRTRGGPNGMGAMGGFFDDLVDSVFDAVDGLKDAIGDALTSVVNIVKEIGETLALVVRAAIGDVKWSEVMDSLGEVFQEVGNVIVVLNPIRITADFLREAPLTAHAFNELDKFTGGMLTTTENISTLVGRAMRGDPISKYELLQDAILIIQVCAIIFTGPVGVGIMIGTMVGREVCSKQTEARDACMVAFQIAGAAAGTWASAASGVTWGAAAEIADDTALSAAEENAFLAGDEAYQNFLLNQAEAEILAHTTSFLPHLVAAVEAYGVNQGINLASNELSNLCAQQGWAGKRECQILSEVAGNYLRNELTTQVPFEEFLASEVARIGAEELMLQWFPPDSPEYHALARRWQIKYVDVPVPGSNQVVVKRASPGALLMAAAGGALLLLGGAS